MRVAAYQAPLSAAESGGIIGHIEQRVRWCEFEGVTLLCCPEAVIGGLADYSNEPAKYALRAAEGELVNALASETRLKRFTASRLFSTRQTQVSAQQPIALGIQVR